MEIIVNHSYDRLAAKQAWEEGTFIRTGKLHKKNEEGKLVLTGWFVEVTPTAPVTFIRAHGETTYEAEEKAWHRYEQYRSCKEHEYETRGYRNGAGFCKNCGLFSSEVYTPQEIGCFCAVCQEPTFFSTEGDKIYCEKHCKNAAEYEKLFSEDGPEFSKEELEAALKEVLQRMSENLD